MPIWKSSFVALSAVQDAGNVGTILRTCDAAGCWQEFRAFLKRSGATLIGTSPHAQTTYREAGYQRPFVILAGSEAKGLTSDEMKACHQLVSIPMVGQRDSLNVAVATSVVLYEAFSRRGHYERDREQGIPQEDGNLD